MSHLTLEVTLKAGLW